MLFRALGGLATAAIASLLIAGLAWATGIWPPEDEWTGSSSIVQIDIGDDFETVCTVSTLAGTVPAEPNNEDVGDPITVDIDTPVFSSCESSLEVFGFEVAGETTTVVGNATNGPWQLALDAGSSPTVANLVIPEDGLTIEVPEGSCEYLLAPGAAEPVAGEWTNGTDSISDPSVLAVDAEVAVSRTAGSGVCPDLEEGSVTASYEVFDTAVPADPILVENQPFQGYWVLSNMAEYEGDIVAASSSITTSWTYNSNARSFTCAWDLAGKVSNKDPKDPKVVKPGNGQITSGTFKSCTTNTPTNCKLDKLETTFPWDLQAYFTGGKRTVRIGLNLKMTFSTVTGQPACPIPATVNWIGNAGIAPRWTNGTAPGKSVATFDGTTGQPSRSGNPSVRLTFTGDLSVETSGKALLHIQ